MNIRVNRKSYTTLSNYPIIDRNLSAISLGIFTYIMSKPDGWKAHKNEIYKRFSDASITTSKNAIDQAFKELVNIGYVEIKTIVTTNEKGQKIFNGREYVFNEEPKTVSENLPNSEDFGSSEIPDVGYNPTSKKVPHIVNTDFKEKTEKEKEKTDFVDIKDKSYSKKSKVGYKENESIEDVKYYFEFTQIINLLEERTNAKYKIPKTAAELSKYKNYITIKERLEDGSTLEECLNVIESKFAEWTGTDMQKYLVIETLFRKSNFEKYLVQSQINTPKKVKDEKGNYADTKEGSQQFIFDLREGVKQRFVERGLLKKRDNGF